MIRAGATDKLQALVLTGKRQIVPKGEVVRTSEDSQSFYFVKKGFVKRYLIANEGRVDIQSIYGPGYFFPQITVFSGLFNQQIYDGPETFYYETISLSVLYSIPVDDVAKAAEADNSLYRELLLIAGRRLQANIQQIENRSLNNAYKQVAHQITFLAREFGEKTRKGIKIKLPLTHQFLADVLSVTRETVSQGMVRLSKAGLIKPARKNIIVPNIKKLENEAYK